MQFRTHLLFESIISGTDEEENYRIKSLYCTINSGELCVVQFNNAHNNTKIM